MSSISLAQVGYRYQGTDGKALTALDGIDLEIPSGKAVCIIGPSGCGKSTLLALLAGLKKPSSGTVSIDGVALGAPRVGTGFIPQGGGLLPWKKVLANAGLGLELRGVPKQEREAAARSALSQVGLATRENAYPHELSGGMRQRLALARCLASGMDLLLADEPLSALDALTREQMQQTLLDFWLQLGYTQVLITHSVEEAVLLGEGIVVLSPAPGSIAGVVQNPRIAEAGHRESADFTQVCAEVRSVLNSGGTALQPNQEVQ
jgi:NitT/TauT family transport system ATP-binding protein